MIRQESSDFLRQKQAQWDKEKAESESRPEWFPFGDNSTPGGGSPLRKFVSKEPINPKSSEEESTSMYKVPMTDSVGEKQETNDAPSQLNHHCQQYHVHPLTAHNHSHQHHGHHPYSYPIYTYPYPIAPTFHQNPMSSSTSYETAVNSEDKSTQHTYFAPQYQVIPAGAIPVSTINIDPSQICPVDQMGVWTLPPPTGPNGMRYGIPVPAPLVPQITASIMEASRMNSSTKNTVINAMTSSTSSNDSSSESGVSGVKETKEDKKKKKVQEEKVRHDERQSTSDYTDDDPVPLTRRSTGSVTYNYADQIAERRKYEQEQEDRERQELLEIERQRRILEDRRASEEEERKRIERERLEEEQRRADLFAAAMEKAKKEAELLKRAKLYKHVLKGAEEEGGTEQLSELEQKLLGVDIETGRRLLKEVSEVEWHKKQDEVEMRKNAPQSDRSYHNNSSMTIGSHLVRGRSSSISSPDKMDNTFARNSVGRRSVRTTSREKEGITVAGQRTNTVDLSNSSPIGNL
uniref:CCDC66 domain-containing protein n=1 Tax=Caenorhabditis tropicalis TaxID=1561998 RepID=A0A1I7TDJ4_9PELO